MLRCDGGTARKALLSHFASQYAQKWRDAGFVILLR